MLRVCKYSVEDCLAIFRSLNDDGMKSTLPISLQCVTIIIHVIGVLDYSEGSGKDPFRSLTEKQLKDTVNASA